MGDGTDAETKTARGRRVSPATHTVLRLVGRLFPSLLYSLL